MNKIIYIIIIGSFIIGLFSGILLSYKVEANTLNQALDSLESCYNTYALPMIRYEIAYNISIPKNMTIDELELLR